MGGADRPGRAAALVPVQRPNAAVGGTIEFSGDPYTENNRTGTILVFEPPRRLAYTWGNDELHFELEPAGDGGCALTLIDVLEAPSGTPSPIWMKEASTPAPGLCRPDCPSPLTPQAIRVKVGITIRSAQLPNPTACRPVADPSWNQDAACPVRPLRRNNVSSTATSTAWPGGTSSSTTSRDNTALTSSTDHRAREKNRCAQWCDQARDIPAPVSMPHTVRRAGCAKNPPASAQKVRNVGAVEHGRNNTSSVISDGGNATLGPRSIGALDA